MNLQEIRDELARRETKLEADILRFNSLHKKAKYLKKQMVEDRKVIDSLEAEIARKK